MEDTTAPGLTVHLAGRLDTLADGLVVLLDGPRDDAFATDVVSVPTPGVQRWLAQRLAQRLGAVSGDGVCAGISFETLTGLCEESLAAGAGRRRDDDPWRGERLVWAMLRAFEVCGDADWFGPVATHLAVGDDVRPGRRYATARRLAGLYRRWLTWHADVLQGWLLNPSPSWQARLWPLLVEQVGSNPFDDLRTALARLAEDPAIVSLPPVVHVFSPDRVTPSALLAVRALARHRSVHAWLPVPEAGELGGMGAVRHRQAALWQATASAVHQVTDRPGPATLLQALQVAARNADGAVLDDGSVEVHASHGPERQVEVLRDVLVDLLARDPDLEPRHIVVLTPDLDTYGPLVRARCTLGDLAPAEAMHPAHGIRVGVADRSQRQANPILDVLARLLDLATSRGEVSELLDLCATAPVGRRFGFRSADSIERLEQLLRESGVRWGMDLKTRRRFGVNVVQNTWQTGLNRLLLGLTMSERELPTVGTVIPYDVLESQDVTTVGSLAELMGRLRSAAEEFGTPATPAAWVDRFRRALFGTPDEDGVVVGGLVSVSAAEGWQVAHAQAQLSQIAEQAGSEAPMLSLGDVKVLVRDRLHGRLPRSALFTGQLTVTALDAIPCVPHPVVVVVGLDDQSFPRPVVAEGDDVLGRSPDESNPALDDRQAFLDALLAAERRFVVVYRGRDTRTNEEVPAPIPVQELIRGCESYGAKVVVDHRLQPFDLDGFAVGAPVSYDHVAAASARALADGRSHGAPPPRSRTDLTGLPPAQAEAEVGIDELVMVLRNPWDYFRRRRLQVTTWSGAETSDQIPIDMTGLSDWNLKSRLLELRLAGYDRTLAEHTERLRGGIPPARLGTTAMEVAGRQVDGTIARLGLPDDAPESVVDVAVSVMGTVVTGRVKVRGTRILAPTVGFMKGRHFLAPWVQLLAVAATDPGRSWTAVVANDRKLVTLAPPADPVAELARIVRLRLDALSSLVPLPVDVAFAWATALGVDHAAEAEKRARREWDYDHSYKGTVYESFEALRDAPGPGGPGAFARLAEAVYGPLVAGGAR